MAAQIFADDIQRRVLQDTLEVLSSRSDLSADPCVICLEEVTEPCEAWPCQHRAFDYVCLVNWLYQTPRCPLCNASIDKVTHGSDGGQRRTTLFPLKEPQPQPQPSTSAAASSSPPFARTQRAPRTGLPCRRHRPRRSSPALGTSVPLRRREVYDRRLFSKHVGSSRLSKYRELTPQMFASDAELVSRARMFIRRELRVFEFLSTDNADDASVARGSGNDRAGVRTASERRRANNAEFLLEYIIAILKSVDIMGSAGQAEDMLSDFLGRDNTRLFLHELRAWLRSPFTKLEDWDRAVQYDANSSAWRRRGSAAGVGRTGGASPSEGPLTEDRFRGRYRGKGVFYRSAPRTRRRLNVSQDSSRNSRSRA